MAYMLLYATNALFFISAVFRVSVRGEPEFEPQPYDGWYNNLQHPEWGATDTQLIRRSKVAYSDGVYQPSGKRRPNPLEISRAVHRGPTGLASYHGRTTMLVYFGVIRIVRLPAYNPGQQIVEEIVDSQRPGCPIEYMNLSVSPSRPELCQQIVEEIVDSQRPGCPIEYMNLPVPPSRPEFDPHARGNLHMTFKRSRYDQRTGYSPNNPRQQLNEITPYLDGQVIYGPAKAWTDAIRSFRGGRLAGTNPGLILLEFPLDNAARLPFANPPVAWEHELKPVSRFHAIGNPRGHENPFLLSFGVLWFRWHNHVADSIAREHPEFNDEQIFNIARKRVIAQYQKIVFYDWLPVWLNTSMSVAEFRDRYKYNSSYHANTQYCRYNPNLHPGINHEFQAAAMRFGHTLIPPGLWRTRANCEHIPSTSKLTGRRFAALRLCNSFWDAKETVEEDLGALFRGMASTVAEREDAIMVSDLTDSLFGPLEFSRRDLAALNIQRGRDHGLADYNTVRAAYGLPRKRFWIDINRHFNKNQIQGLVGLYRNLSIGARPDDVDLFTGGLLETTPTGPGELFHTITLEQFLRIRHADRFWFENTEHSGLDETELSEVWNRGLNDIIDTVTTAKRVQMQRNVFLRPDFDTGCQVQPTQLNDRDSYEGTKMLEACSPIQFYDYFTGSEVPYALTLFLLFVTVPVTFLIMYLLARRRRRSRFQVRSPPPPLQRTTSANLNEFRVLEWVDSDALERIVTVCLEQSEGRISVYNTRRSLLRFIDVKLTSGGKGSRFELHLSSDKQENLLNLKLKEYDLVMRFYNQEDRGRFVARLEQFLEDSVGAGVTVRSLVESYILRTAVTRHHRQERLNEFFKTILNMFNEGETDVEENIYGTVNPVNDTTMTRIELTQAEFGEAFGMRPNSTFVKHMFLLVDANNSGHVSFKEFMNVFILLTSDDVDSKITLLFNMYDIKRHGYLALDDLSSMIRSLLDLSENNVTDSKVSEFVDAVYKSANLRHGSKLTFADFKRVFASSDYVGTLKKATMDLHEPEDQDQAASPNSRTNSKMMQRRATLVRGYSISGPSSRHRSYSTLSGGGKYSTLATHDTGTSNLNVFTDKENKAPVGVVMQTYVDVISYLETYKLQVFWMTLFCLVTSGVFMERAYFYAMERENGGLRRICGHGVTVSRGSASVLMFTYASLLLTMCRNLITRLRETVLHRFVPFDSIHFMHQFIAYLSLFFTVVHVVGHAFNLYHISTQPSTDLNCYFREYFRASDELASFQYWAFTTMTGLTGIVATIIIVVLFVFALPYARRHVFHAFWNTHKLYVAIYVLIVLHGSARLVQTPHFPWYLLGPAVLYTIDKLISSSRNTLELTVIKAELLPSDVTAIVVNKPEGFEYKSGQWAQVACTALGHREFHPFTMTSAPHEKHVTFHIRAVGPWTTNLRQVYDPSNRSKCMPRLRLDGPFGEGHQDWYRYEVSVLIGGGIGVTPFASILKDIVHKSSMDITIQCKKVYFLWVTRTQKQFEWMTDIIRDLEAVDQTKLVTTHIFVTEFKTKFDLRTSMLYICERHFQKIAGKSLFTGLVATTHFGRPRFQHFLQSLRYKHRKATRVGVFSCGPRPMTLEVERACTALNRFKTPTYYHHYENF